MKTLKFLPVALFMIIASVNGQSNENNPSANMNNQTVYQNARKEKKEIKKEERNAVSYQSKAAFTEEFSKANLISSEKVNGFDKFTFTRKGKEMSAFYDMTAKLVGTIQTKKFSDLPVVAQNTMLKEYNGFTPGQVIFYDDNELNETNMVLYGTTSENKDSYFVEMDKKSESIVLQVDKDGSVSYFMKKDKDSKVY